MKPTLLLIALALVVAGCSNDYQLKVDSNTLWTAQVGDQTIQGGFSKTIDIPDDLPQCVLVTNRGAHGWVQATIIEHTGNPLTSDQKASSGRVDYPFGTATVCIDK